MCNFFPFFFFSASEPLADTVVLELVDDVIDRHERARRRHSLSHEESQTRYEHEHSKTTEAIPQSQLPFIIEASEAQIIESGQKLWGTRNLTVRTLAI